MFPNGLAGFITISVSDPRARAILQSVLREMIEKWLGPSLPLEQVRAHIANNSEIPEETKNSLLDPNERVKNYVWYSVVAQPSVGCPFKPNELIAVVHPLAGQNIALAAYFSTNQPAVMPVARISWIDIARQTKQ